MVGDFTSLVLLEADCSVGASFERRARALQDQLWSDLDHAYFSGIQVLREVHRRRGGGARALMPVVLTSALFSGRGEGDELLRPWQDEQRFGISQTPQVYLDHGVSEQGGALVYGWDAVDELFPPGVVDAMFGAYERLLSALSSDEGTWEREGRGWLLPEAQVARRAEYNRTSREVPAARLEESFFAWARRQPERVAVIAPGRELSYGELAGRATALAGELRRLDVSPGEAVGVVMEKGWEQVAAVLAVLEAGGVYVPVDASWPEERREHLLAVTRARVALTQPWLAGESGWPAGVARLAVGEEEPSPRGRVAPAGDAEDLAYVIFTSGSTGDPKGVMIAHAAAWNTVAEVNERLGLGASDRVLALSSLSFDLSVWDLFGALSVGGAVVVPGSEARRDPGAWLEWLERAEVTVWNSVPALMEMLVEYTAGRGERLPERLRGVLLSGDWIPVSLPERLRRVAAGEPALWSLGGATEASIWSIAHRIEAVDPGWASIPYGRPLANQGFHVLDGSLEPRPEWAVGELYISGLGLARGYWGDEERTSRSFVRHPASGERLYRTGDLGRFRPEGWIEFLGREDFQVKVQGYRIELGEIEAALLQHPEVQEAVVTAPAGANGQRRLVAHVVAGAPEPPAEDTLRATLGRTLPGYMVPGLFLFHETLPLTANGKIDRGALDQAVDEAGTEPSAGATESPTEEVVAALVAQVLDAPRVTAGDNFFELGGDSVSGIYFVSRLRQTFGVEVPLRVLFESPTVADLADAVAGASAGSAPGAVPLVPLSEGAERPLSFAQQRLWFLDYLQPDSPVYNIAFALRLEGDLDRDALQRAFDDLVLRHEALRSRFPADRGRPVLVVEPAARLELRLQEVPGGLERSAELAGELGREPFDLTVAPLARARLFRAAPDDHLLAFSMHHIVSDAASIEILIRDLAALYRQALATGDGPGLPSLPLRYSDFAAWQRGLHERGLLGGQLDHWRERLAGAVALELPTDAPRPAKDRVAGVGERYTFALPAELSAELEVFSRRRGLTLFMTLLAGFVVALHRFSGQSDVVVSTSTSNRTREALRDVVGCFLNSLLLRVSVAPGSTLAEVLEEVRKASVEAFGNQDVPFEEVMRAVLGERPIGYAPLSRVIFGLRRSEVQTLDVPRLRLSPVEIERRAVKFDLELQMVTKPQGLTGFLEYDRDLFKPQTVERLMTDYIDLLKTTAQDPDRRVGDLEPGRTDGAEGAAAGGVKRPSLRDFKPRPVALSAEDLVKTSPLFAAADLPLLVEPSVSGLDLGTWLEARNGWVDERLLRHGAVLFRGFSVPSIERFEGFAAAFSGGLMEYTERSTPRTRVQANVYTSTEYPPDQAIPLHNENSYSHVWPSKLWFHCLVAAEEGGATPIADSRRVYQDLDPAVRERFEDRGVLYVRNYGNSLGLSWQEAFQTEDRKAVETYCERAGIEWRWIDGSWLQTRQVRPAASRHPQTGDQVWFNQAHLFHASALDPEVARALSAILDEERFPRNAYYGDGTPIEPETLEEIRRVYDETAVAFPWQAGDVLLVDNIRVAHGRQAYRGARKVVVAMADPASGGSAPDRVGTDPSRTNDD